MDSWWQQWSCQPELPPRPTAALAKAQSSWRLVCMSLLASWQDEEHSSGCKIQYIFMKSLCRVTEHFLINISKYLTKEILSKLYIIYKLGNYGDTSLRSFSWKWKLSIINPLGNTICWHRTQWSRCAFTGNLNLTDEVCGVTHPGIFWLCGCLKIFLHLPSHYKLVFTHHNSSYSTPLLSCLTACTATSFILMNLWNCSDKASASWN